MKPIKLKLGGVYRMGYGGVRKCTKQSGENRFRLEDMKNGRYGNYTKNGKLRLGGDKPSDGLFVVEEIRK